MLTEQYWMVGGGVAVVVLLGLLLGSIWRRRRRPQAVQILRTASLETAHDVLLPNGMGGQIHIEHLLLTAQGLVVIDSKDFVGRIFGSDLMDEWTVIGPEGRYTFPNPQMRLYDRVAAVRRLVRDDVPVQGHVLFSPGADFSGGRPTTVILPEEFAERYQKPDKAELEELQEALQPHWDRIKQIWQAA
ncbi:MAG TPA: nuclease-related domain-containing protein [Gammaproteobacteria bacterium]|nr:nuclease-related domain-containing protein [Gammaproteobacteria bacterium]